MTSIRDLILRGADLLMAPAVYPAAALLKLVRTAGVERLPLCRRVLRQVGVFPVRNHYYEPLFDDRELREPLDRPRPLPGIEWEDEAQLELLERLRFADELESLASREGELSFRVDNPNFAPGDAEFWYGLVRVKKPRRIFEIGSGNSTLLAIEAVRRNAEESPGYRCQHVCIEPYEMPWLERSGVTVVRRRVEEVERGFFAELEAGDILFIDSSHVIRPQGDVLFEYLELLPTLKPGVIVHVHDIFSPRDYPREWLIDAVRLWNEQYLLEAFLTGNRQWRILAALNHLRHGHFDRLKAAAPFLTPECEPGSFYIEKTA